MPLILGAQSATATGFSVDNSCRFNGSDEKMGKTLGTPTDLNKWTYSAWIKLGAVSTLGYIFECTTGASNFTAIKVDSTARLFFGNYNSGYLGQRDLTRLFRDPSAWYHIVAVWDSDNGVAADRMKLYVNGVHQTTYHGSTNPTSGEACQMASGADLWVAVHQSTNDYFSGYMAEVCFIDGSALTPSDFGEYDGDSPTVWKPIDVSGLTFGNNGFYLDFKDSANLGNDANGGTDLTETNLDAADQATDTPTNNFTTVNSLEYMGGSSPTFSKGNCQYVQGGVSQYYPSAGTVGLTAGKWYWELQTIDGTKNGSLIGIAGDAAIATNYIGTNNVLGYTAQQWAISAIGSGYRNNNGYTAYGVGFYGNVIVGVYLDLDNNKLYFASGGTIMQTGTGIDITAAASTDAGYYVPACNYWGGGETFQCNFGGCPAFTVSSAQQDANGYGNFEYSPNDGGSASFDGSAKDFLAICTKNLGSDGG